MTDDLPDPIPAATLILMRPGPDELPEILFMERAATMAFAAGALVFPGGRIDPDDHLLAEGRSEPDAAARIAAIRETIEETGLAVAIAPAPQPEQAAQLRRELDDGTPFSALVEASGLALNLDALTPFARWCPTFRETRRFDTFFFLAEAPPESQTVSADSREGVRTFWASAEAVLEAARVGDARIIFPTRRNLERLARFASINEARVDADHHAVRKIVPWIEARQGTDWLCIPDDAGYPVTAELLDTARRR